MELGAHGDEFAEYEKSARSVFVGNIPYEVTEERLKDIFSAVGPVVSFKLVYDRENGKPRGYGFCEFQDPHLARTAINNLNGFEVGGRSLRVDSACTEKTRMEMQSIMSTAAESSKSAYGEAVDPEEAPEKISKAVASLPPEQMFELMKQMMFCIRNNPDEAKEMLLKNPQLSYALLQALVVMRVVDVETAVGMLHDPMPRPPNLASQKSSLAASRPFPQASFENPDQFPERQVPPPTFDPPRGTRDESNSRFAVRDPRSRDPRADRDPRVERGISRDLDSSQRGAPPSIPPELAGADPARRQLLMQVLQLNDEQIAMLPAEQRASILQLRKQLNKGSTF